MRYKLTVYDEDGSITYESNKADELIRQLESLKKDEPEDEARKERIEDYEADTHKYTRRLTPYERTRNAVYATGNKWAIENFNATHNW